MTDEEELKKIIGNSGVLNLYYGGYEIEVTNYRNFKWKQVFKCLFKFSYNVFITEKNNNICIIAKQSSN
ncbi:MAG: hypothetical protein QXE31_01655 [Candidatus Woesearchaeota archaeon]